MATESPPPPLLSNLGPCELSWLHQSDCLFVWVKRWLFWSSDDDELRHHHRSPLPFSNNGDPTTKEKIKCALLGLASILYKEYYQNYLVQVLHEGYRQNYLVQFWGLVHVGDSRYLTTCDQPFALSLCVFSQEGQEEEGLCQYRKHCLEYLIAVDETSVEEGELGPAGRVFRSGLPELIVDVNHYSSEEYPQRDLAVKYYLKSYFAFPVYQSPGRTCLGVLEFVSLVNEYSFPWDKLADLLKEMDLTTIVPVSLFDYAQSSSCHNREIDEIAKVLQVVCNTHQIPVAQIWIEANSKQLATMCKRVCWEPFYFWFQDVYRSCFIQNGYGVVGKAFSSLSACFCRDVRQLNITEYPFVLNARKYGFSNCFAICLRSSCSSSCIYTLEFLFSTNETGPGDIRTLLHMIIETLKQHLQSSFKVASGQNLGQNLLVKVIKVFSDDNIDFFEICHTTSGEFTFRPIEVQNHIGMTLHGGSFQQVDAANNSIYDINVQQNVIVGSPQTLELVQNVGNITHRQPIEELDVVIPAKDDASIEHFDNKASSLTKRGSAYTLESARGITLEVLQLCSAMKLVDAAKDLGVSRSTLKRICRRYDIHRWPPHKARKYSQAIDQQELAQLSEKNIGTHSMSIATRLPDDRSIMVKATYGDVIIKFQLSLSAQKMDLYEKVAMRLNLPVESFRIMYLDEEDDWVSITCDEDLSISLSMLRPIGKTTIKMLVSQ